MSQSKFFCCDLFSTGSVIHVICNGTRLLVWSRCKWVWNLQHPVHFIGFWILLKWERKSVNIVAVYLPPTERFVYFLQWIISLLFFPHLHFCILYALFFLFTSSFSTEFSVFLLPFLLKKQLCGVAKFASAFHHHHYHLSSAFHAFHFDCFSACKFSISSLIDFFQDVRTLPLSRDRITEVVQSDGLGCIWTPKKALEYLLLGGQLADAVWFVGELGDWKAQLVMSATVQYHREQSTSDNALLR